MFDWWNPFGGLGNWFGGSGAAAQETAAPAAPDRSELWWDPGRYAPADPWFTPPAPSPWFTPPAAPAPAAPALPPAWSVQLPAADGPFAWSGPRYGTDFSPFLRG